MPGNSQLATLAARLSHPSHPALCSLQLCEAGKKEETEQNFLSRLSGLKLLCSRVGFVTTGTRRECGEWARDHDMDTTPSHDARQGWLTPPQRNRFSLVEGNVACINRNVPIVASAHELPNLIDSL